MTRSLKYFGLLVAIGAIFAVCASTAHADDKPLNVTGDGDEWLRDAIPAALPYLIQTRQGPLDTDHVHVVDELGTWGAGRARGKHQGVDFVVDMPHKAGSDRLLVGSIVEGRVVHAEAGWGSYGNTVFVHREAHPQLVVIYAHLASLDVGVGDTVEVGDIIGNFGCTGNCKGLEGLHVRNQVHVEMYQLPDNFQRDDITWDVLPMRQLRTVGEHTRRKPYGIDVLNYVGDAGITKIARLELGEVYAKHKHDGGLAAYLGEEDVDAVMALAAAPPTQDGIRGGHIEEPGEEEYYYGEVDDELDDDDDLAPVAVAGAADEPVPSNDDAATDPDDVLEAVDVVTALDTNPVSDTADGRPAQTNEAADSGAIVAEGLGATATSAAEIHLPEEVTTVAPEELDALVARAQRLSQVVAAIEIGRIAAERVPSRIGELTASATEVEGPTHDVEGLDVGGKTALAQREPVE